MKKAIIYEQIKKVAIITINLPEKKNSLDHQSISDLSVAWKKFEKSSNKVAIITSLGDYFCAGVDLKNIPDASYAVPGIGVKVTKPIIASVNGPAIGLGLTLAMQSDLCIASKNSYFLYPEAKIGYTGGLISGLVAKIPYKNAMEILLLGKKINAKRAFEVGLINEIVEESQTLVRAKEIAFEISELSSTVITAIKSEVNHTMPKSPAEISGRFLNRILSVKNSDDRIEGLKAFNERRKAIFNK